MEASPSSHNWGQLAFGPEKFFFFFCLGLQDSTLPPRSLTRAHCSGSLESQPLDYQGILPEIIFLLVKVRAHTDTLTHSHSL